MLSITMPLKISARLRPQVTTIIYHHMKKILLKKENTKIHRYKVKSIIFIDINILKNKFKILKFLQTLNLKYYT